MPAGAVSASRAGGLRRERRAARGGLRRFLRDLGFFFLRLLLVLERETGREGGKKVLQYFRGGKKGQSELWLSE